MKKKFRRKVLGVWYTAQIVSNSDPRLEGNDGICDTKAKKVFIAEKPDSHTLKNVIEHEFCHAVLHEAKVRDLDSHFEHVIVESLAEYLEENFNVKAGK